MFITINNQQYDIDTITKLVEDPYDYISQLPNTDDIKHVYDFFINKEDYEEEKLKNKVSALIDIKMSIYINTNIQILPFLINEYFIDNKGSNYKKIYNLIFYNY